MDREIQRALHTHSEKVKTAVAEVDLDVQRLSLAFKKLVEADVITRLGWVLFGSKFLIWRVQAEFSRQAKARVAVVRDADDTPGHA
jgi:hypothetical protein